MTITECSSVESACTANYFSQGQKLFSFEYKLTSQFSSLKLSTELCLKYSRSVSLIVGVVTLVKKFINASGYVLTYVFNVSF